MITSSSNQHIKYLRNLLQDCSFRYSENCFVLEHPKAIRELAQQMPNMIQSVYIVDGAVIPSYLLSFQSYILSEPVFKMISGVKTSQGIVALVSIPHFQENTTRWKRVAVLDGVQDPHNVGAVCRSAVAFGMDAVLLTENSADPFHPKSLRAMAGACWHIPFISHQDSRLPDLFDLGFQLYVLDAHQGIPLSQLTPAEKSVFVVGSEGQGVVTDLQLFSPISIHIPMDHGVESLNVAVSAGIVMSSL